MGASRVVLLSGLLSCLFLATPAATAASVFGVAIGDDCESGDHECFQPDLLVIDVGDSVGFFSYCEMYCWDRRNVVADDGSFRCARGCDGEGGSGEPIGFPLQISFVRTFNKPGVVQYHDEVTGVKGAIIVRSPTATTVVEYFNLDLGTYFITADPGEQTFVDGGGAGRWQRTGDSFKAGGPTAVCRFSGSTAFNLVTMLHWGPNSHFFTADRYECDAVKASRRNDGPSWVLESYDFTTTVVGPAGCATDQVPVYRAYNGGFERKVDSNHRITANAAAYSATVATGWIGEGVVMCAPR